MADNRTIEEKVSGHTHTHTPVFSLFTHTHTHRAFRVLDGKFKEFQVHKFGVRKGKPYTPPLKPSATLLGKKRLQLDLSVKTVHKTVEQMRLLANTLRRQIHIVQENEYEHQVLKARRVEWAAEELAGLQERANASKQAQDRHRSAVEVNTPSFEAVRALAAVPSKLEYESSPARGSSSSEEDLA